MGQWPDKLVPIVWVIALVGILAGLLLAFLYASPVNGASVNGAELIGGQIVANKLLLSQKIFYVHMPVAIASMVMLAFMAYYSIRFLMTREQRFDTCAICAMEVTLLFVLGTMITGEMWTRFEWGVWWTWEPRLTTYLILTLLVVAYFVLRNAVDDPERRSVYAAVLGVISFINVPITFLVTRFIPSSLHPVVFREGGMTPDMALTVAVFLVGILALSFVLYRIRFRNARLEERTRALEENLEE
jgi:heme exporter protein C